MKPPRTAQPMPRYCRRKLLKNGTWAYFFEIPTWAKEQGCKLENEPLGSDYAAAVKRAEEVLLPAFDSWRSRGLTDMVPCTVAPGSFDWLVSVFKSHRAWKEVDRKTQRLYEQGMTLFADYVLKDGSRAGARQLSEFTKGFVDAVYDKLLYVPVVDDKGKPVMGKDGKPVLRERRRFANAAMQGCRRAWFIGMRAEEKIVPQTNPFAKMGLKTRTAGTARKETPTATWDELVAFREKAKALGYHSIATAALTAWEWLQREEHVFGAFDVRHYRPKERPNSVCVVHPKTGEEAWWPLFDETGETLFPELMAELDAIKAKTIAGLVFRRDHAHRRGAVLKPWITEKGGLDYLRSTVKDIVRAAGLRDELSFTSFRHGGFTEGADSDWTDAELRAAGRHKSARQLPTYAKRTRKQLISATQKRRAERTKAGGLSE
ncbi:hypothetical protein AFIC_001016 [[Pseudomonas] carboxydohydrogena]|uniref:Uncharacterized protein n=1 Tax=Afipia carboxydohydrogena TaxID=290 RepID=A0ABY8BRA0_AFICR|nr:hypothetical protein [[Pseudomonas] carboxydohydrogena]WEF52525.1 hypothetical protein AFIC_001016 [[Pseudomonas] carboxydohydrogena]